MVEDLLTKIFNLYRACPTVGEDFSSEFTIENMLDGW
jgi:hypothetical protein